MPRIVLPYPHTGQRIVRQQAKRFNWLAAGRRWRKTTIAMSIVVESVANRGQYIWGAPTFDQVRTCWDEMRKAAGSTFIFNQGRMEVEYHRSKVYFRSLDDPDNVRSKTADGVVIDEVGFVSPKAWYEVLQPMLVDTKGWLWAIGTPEGRNWFWQEFEQAREHPDSMCWQAPTLGVDITAHGLVRTPHPLENPNIAFEEMQRLYQGMTERSFRQEFLAQFVEDGGGVLRKVRQAATATPIERAVPGRSYVAGVDWGRTNDATVITVMDMEAQAVVYCKRLTDTSYPLQKAILKEVNALFRPVTIIAEYNSMGGPQIEDLQNEDVPVRPFVTTNATKAQIVDALALAFEMEQIRILDDPLAIAEYEAYESKRTPSGLVQYSAPEGMHDDHVMSLALAWYACNRGGLMIAFG